MRRDANRIERVALITRIAELDPDVGRTALMKYAYLLQTVKDVPLGYDFELYSYGPYDNQVLADASYGRAIGAVKEQKTEYSGGTKVGLLPETSAADIKNEASEFLNENEAVITWAVDNFRNCNAGEMELLGTLVFADREAAHKGETRSKDALVKIVRAIKPWATVQMAEKAFEKLKSLRAFVAVEGTP